MKTTFTCLKNIKKCNMKQNETELIFLRNSND